MADVETGEFWALFGGFAPLPRKAPSEDNGEDKKIVIKLIWYLTTIFPCLQNFNFSCQQEQ
jgi:hypothetical protein